jgi:hypothetical protein
MESLRELDGLDGRNMTVARGLKRCHSVICKGRTTRLSYQRASIPASTQPFMPASLANDRAVARKRIAGGLLPPNRLSHGRLSTDRWAVCGPKLATTWSIP